MALGSSMTSIWKQAVDLGLLAGRRSKRTSNGLIGSGLISRTVRFTGPYSRGEAAVTGRIRSSNAA